VYALLVVKIWNFFRGYVVIRIEGLSLEKFINYAISRGVYFWDIIRVDYTTLEAKVGLKGYKELRHIVKRVGCKVKIYGKIGYPFFVHKIKVRKMFLVGFVISLLLIIVGTSFIWNIEVFGNKSISTQKIIGYLKSNNLYPGVFKYHVNLLDIENNMMLEFEDIAWVGINLKGTKVIVDIVEKVKPPKKIPVNIPCDIIAAKNGVVEKIIAKNGDALVEKGDIVKSGQVLITGVLNRDNLESRYVHALGEVYAKTYYEETDEIALIKKEKIKTGNMVTRRIVRIGNSQIVLGHDEIPYSNVIIEKRNKRIPSWRNIKIPVEIIIEEYYEAKDTSVSIDKEVAKKALQEKILVKLINRIPVNASILDQRIAFYEKENILYCKINIEALEQIGIQRMLFQEN